MPPLSYNRCSLGLPEPIGASDEDLDFDGIGNGVLPTPSAAVRDVLGLVDASSFASAKVDDMFEADGMVGSEGDCEEK